MNSSLFPSDKIFTVTELNGLIREILEGTFPSITIEAEISGLKQHSSGHLYFNLKDSESVISAVMFKGSTYSLDFKPKDGTKVQATGRLSVYGPQGKYQIIVNKMSVYGEGAILRMLEERKRRLYAEGFFDESKKKRLPSFPKTIGVVTSPTGAALRDIIQITKRRNSKVSVIVLPSLVQGEDAAESIVKQIKNANAAKLCDVLIVGRGGGSIEDLLPFSEESVIRAIYESEIPVISAVGHEIDWALSDFAADMRAPTPSAAAELAVPQLQDILYNLEQHKKNLYETCTQKVERIKIMLESFNSENLEIKFRSIEQPLLQRFDNAKDYLFDNILLRIKDTRNLIQNCVTVLENASPYAIFERGYSMVREKNTNKVIRNSNELHEGDEIEIIPAKGRITATVNETK